jgi:hypothetical protein
LNVVVSGEDTSSILEVISLEASSTISVFGMSGALVRNGNANTVSILNPSVRADEANLIVPIPGSATKVGGVHVIGGREDTGTVDEVISLEASSTISVISVS